MNYEIHMVLSNLYRQGTYRISNNDKEENIKRKVPVQVRRKLIKT